MGNDNTGGAGGCAPCSRRIFAASGLRVDIAWHYGSSSSRCMIRVPSSRNSTGSWLQHKVVSIDRQLIDQGVNSFWAICVDYLSHAPGEPLQRATCRAAVSTTRRFCLPRNSRSFRGCENCARNWPKPKPYRSMRCSRTNSWRKWCSDAASPRATWRRLKGLARARSTSTRSGCCRCC